MLFATPSGLADDDSLDAALAAVRADEGRRIEVLERAAKAVVCMFSDTQRSGGGSGVVIDPEGYGLTNFHVVQPFVKSRRGFGGLADGKLYPLKLLGVDPGGDIALFKLEGKQRFDYAPLGDSDALRVGQWVAAVGNPFMLSEDYSPTVTLGVISGLHRYQEGRGNLLEYADCIQFSSSINPGNSGGPLFDLAGRVVGINGRASFEERGRVNVGLGYAVSVNQIKRFLPGLRAGRLLEHGTLGATVRRVGHELIVGTVQAFSAAERAGVQLGDEVVAVAGRRVRTPNDYNNILAILPADWPVTLELRRDGQPLELVARLDRLASGTPLLYVVDLDHNHAELAKILDRRARRTGSRVERVFSRVIFEGDVMTETGETGQSFTLSVALQPLSGDRSPAGGAASEEAPLGLAVRREWQNLALPLLRAPQIDLRWELLAGDEVDGRIVNVIERRSGAERHVRWKFDYQTDELRQVAFSSRDAPASVVWSAAAPRDFGSLRWPGQWTRRAPTGERILLEIDSITLAQSAPDRAQLENGPPAEVSE
jgi:S1-C subfamily serine protease